MRNIGRIEINDETAGKIASLFPSGIQGPWFRIVDSTFFNGVLPGTYIEKAPLTMMMGSGLQDGCMCVVLNFHRIDVKAQAVDQEPIGFVFKESLPAENTGVQRRHGDWVGRTDEQEFRRLYWDTELDKYYYPNKIDGTTSGSLHTLPPSGDLEAFHASYTSLEALGITFGATL